MLPFFKQSQDFCIKFYPINDFSASILFLFQLLNKNGFNGITRLEMFKNLTYSIGLINCDN